MPDIIGLQAVTCALRELDSLPPDERALGMDRAQGGYYFLTLHAILLTVAGAGLVAAGFLFHLLHQEIEAIKGKTPPLKK